MILMRCRPWEIPARMSVSVQGNLIFEPIHAPSRQWRCGSMVTFSIVLHQPSFVIFCPFDSDYYPRPPKRVTFFTMMGLLLSMSYVMGRLLLLVLWWMQLHLVLMRVRMMLRCCWRNSRSSWLFSRFYSNVGSLNSESANNDEKYETVLAIFIIILTNNVWRRGVLCPTRSQMAMHTCNQAELIHNTIKWSSLTMQKSTCHITYLTMWASFDRSNKCAASTAETMAPSSAERSQYSSVTRNRLAKLKNAAGFFEALTAMTCLGCESVNEIDWGTAPELCSWCVCTCSLWPPSIWVVGADDDDDAIIEGLTSWSPDPALDFFVSFDDVGLVAVVWTGFDLDTVDGNCCAAVAVAGIGLEVAVTCFSCDDLGCSCLVVTLESPSLSVVIILFL